MYFVITCNNRRFRTYLYLCIAFPEVWGMYNKFNNKFKTMFLKNVLARKCTRIILGAIRVKGRLSIISDESSINRSFIKDEQFVKLRFYQVVRLLGAASDWMNREKFVKIGEELFGTIYDAYHNDNEN